MSQFIVHISCRLIVLLCISCCFVLHVQYINWNINLFDFVSIIREKYYFNEFLILYYVCCVSNIILYKVNSTNEL